MIKFFIIKILKIFDYYYQLKLFSFLKKQNLNSFQTFFDVGAHEGESIVLFSKNFNIKKIYSFEASPENYKKLLNNKVSIQSKFKDLEIYLENYAIGDSKEKLKIKHFSESSSSTLNDINPSSQYLKKKNFFLNLKSSNFMKTFEVEQIRLCDYIEKKKIFKVDFLKIDTEGYEMRVLLGLGKYLQNVSLIMFEHHYDNMIIKNYSFGDIHDLLKRNQFKRVYKYKMPFRKTFEYLYKKID